jgi:MFS family permease
MSIFFILLIITDIISASSNWRYQINKFSTSIRYLSISSFSFALTLVTNTLEPGVLGHQILRFAPIGKHNTILGLVTFLGSLVAMIVLPIVGSLSDSYRGKFGRRFPFFLIGSVFISFSLILIVMSNSLMWLVFGVLGYYFSANIIFGPWMALYPEYVPEKNRGIASGYRSLLDIAALIIGRQAVGFLLGNIEKLGNSALYISILIPIVFIWVGFFVTWKIRMNHIKSSPPKPMEPSKTIDFKKLLVNSFKIDLKTYPNYKIWFINRYLFWTSFTILGTFLLFFIIDVLQISEGNAQSYLGNLAVIIGGGILFVALPAGKLADKIGKKPLIQASGLLASLGSVILISTFKLSLLMIAGFLIGSAAGIFIGASFALVTEIVPKNEAARYLGVSGIASAAGSASARLLGGIIVDPINQAFNSNSIGYLLLYGIAALLFLSSTLVAKKFTDFRV